MDLSNFSYTVTEFLIPDQEKRAPLCLRSLRSKPSRKERKSEDPFIGERGVGDFSEERRTWLKSPVRKIGQSLKGKKILEIRFHVSALLSKFGLP